MSFWDLVRAGSQPAPETPALKRLRHVSAFLCMLSALLIIVLRSVGAVSLIFLAASVLTTFAAVFSTVLLFRRKSRREAEYWTDDRVEELRQSVNARRSVGETAS